MVAGVLSDTVPRDVVGVVDWWFCESSRQACSAWSAGLLGGRLSSLPVLAVVLLPSVLRATTADKTYTRMVAGLDTWPCW